MRVDRPIDATQSKAQRVADLLASLERHGFDDSENWGDDSGARVQCSQCEALVISGVATHELTCPNETVACSNCEGGRVRRNRWSKLCDDCQHDDRDSTDDYADEMPLVEGLAKPLAKGHLEGLAKGLPGDEETCWCGCGSRQHHQEPEDVPLDSEDDDFVPPCPSAECQCDACVAYVTGRDTDE